MAELTLTDFIITKEPDSLPMTELKCEYCNAEFIAVYDREKFLSGSFKCPIGGCIGYLRWNFCGFIPRSVWTNKENFQFEVNNHNITYKQNIWKGETNGNS